MELGGVLIVAGLLSALALGENTTADPSTVPDISNGCSCNHTTPPATSTNSKSSSPAPLLGFLTVKWMGGCRGTVQLLMNLSSSPVCYLHPEMWEKMKTVFCLKQKGCKGDAKIETNDIMEKGYNITEDRVIRVDSCKTFDVRCDAEEIPDVQAELKGYKVVTALLCIILLVVFLMRFTRPTVTALQKRLSDRRQHQWVGPTQSHSVSYHRGKSAIKNEDGEKRFSYPALERLTVADGSDTSCQRNSGYDF